MEQIKDGEEEVILRYREKTREIEEILSYLNIPRERGRDNLCLYRNGRIPGRAFPRGSGSRVFGSWFFPMQQIDGDQRLSRGEAKERGGKSH